MCRTAWALWSVATCILPSLKSECASWSWPPRKLVAVLLDWTVTPSANKPVKDQWGGGGPRSRPVLSSDENNEDPARPPADRGQWLRRWCAASSPPQVTARREAKVDNSEGTCLHRQLDSEYEKGYRKTQPTDFTFSSSSFFFCMHKDMCDRSMYTQISLKGRLQQLK